VDREIRLEGHRLIRAPLQRVWQLLSRLESHPRYASLWMAADLLERSQAAALVEFHGFFGGLPITSVQRVVLRPPGRIEFRQVRGTLRDLSGGYVLKDAGGDTDLVVQLAVDPGIVFFSEASVQQILASHIDGTLAKVKASAERDLVRLTPGALRPQSEPSRRSSPARRRPQRRTCLSARTRRCLRRRRLKRRRRPDRRSQERRHPNGGPKATGGGDGAGIEEQDPGRRRPTHERS